MEWTVKSDSDANALYNAVFFSIPLAYTEIEMRLSVLLRFCTLCMANASTSCNERPFCCIVSHFQSWHFDVTGTNFICNVMPYKTRSRYNKFHDLAPSSGIFASRQRLRNEMRDFTWSFDTCTVGYKSSYLHWGELAARAHPGRRASRSSTVTTHGKYSPDEAGRAVRPSRAVWERAALSLPISTIQ